jgi:hypothetical protein
MPTKRTAHKDMNTTKPTPTPVRKAAESVEPVAKNGNTRWSCSSCGTSVTLFVAVIHPPTHICCKKANRITPLKKEGESNE